MLPQASSDMAILSCAEENYQPSGIDYSKFVFGWVVKWLLRALAHSLACFLLPFNVAVTLRSNGKDMACYVQLPQGNPLSFDVFLSSALHSCLACRGVPSACSTLYGKVLNL
jgi:hypothetical protein